MIYGGGLPRGHEPQRLHRCASASCTSFRAAISSSEVGPNGVIRSAAKRDRRSLVRFSHFAMPLRSRYMSSWAKTSSVSAAGDSSLRIEAPQPCRIYAAYMVCPPGNKTVTKSEPVWNCTHLQREYARALDTGTNAALRATRCDAGNPFNVEKAVPFVSLRATLDVANPYTEQYLASSSAHSSRANGEQLGRVAQRPGPFIRMPLNQGQTWTGGNLVPNKAYSAGLYFSRHRVVAQ